MLAPAIPVRGEILAVNFRRFQGIWTPQPKRCKTSGRWRRNGCSHLPITDHRNIVTHEPGAVGHPLRNLWRKILWGRIRLSRLPAFFRAGLGGGENQCIRLPESGEIWRSDVSLGADVNPATLDYDPSCLVGPGNRIDRFSALACLAANSVAFLLGDFLLTPGKCLRTYV
jgi:hypothetical protein